MRWLLLLPLACVLVGTLAIVGALRAHDAADASAGDLGTPPAEILARVKAAPDWRCEPPRFYRLDEDDVYVETCRGDGMLTRRAGAVVYLDHAARPDGWWARQIFDGGWHLGGAGVATFLIAWLLLALGWPLASVIERHR